MPTETNLPTMVHLYLELINKLQYSLDELDSALPEAKVIQVEISHYLWLIRGEMDKIKKDEDL